MGADVVIFWPVRVDGEWGLAMAGDCGVGTGECLYCVRWKNF